jgi:hypothetical protein
VRSAALIRTEAEALPTDTAGGRTRPEERPVEAAVPRRTDTAGGYPPAPPPRRNAATSSAAAAVTVAS